MKYIDIHAHLNFSDFDLDREEVIERTIKNDMGVINIGTTLETSREVVELAQKYHEFYASVGIHPNEFHDVTDLNSTILELKKLATENPKVVCIGECGLDYFHMVGDPHLYKEIQQNIFRGQIELALELDLPLMIHCRDAYDTLIEILQEYKNKTADEQSEFYQKNLRGDVHFFAGNLDTAKIILELGFNISFTGVVTFAPQYRELIEFVPLDRMHAETDSPFVAPVPFRGQRNEPLYTLEVMKKIAEIKNVPFETVTVQFKENAKNFFGIDF
jgi:TatD DNase family protein